MTVISIFTVSNRTVEGLTQQTAGFRAKLVIISHSCSQHALQNSGFVGSGGMHQPPKSHTLSYFVNWLFHETRRQVQAHHSTACRRHLSHQPRAFHLGQPQILLSFSAKHPEHKAPVTTTATPQLARQAQIHGSACSPALGGLQHTHQPHGGRCCGARRAGQAYPFAGCGPGSTEHPAEPGGT